MMIIKKIQQCVDLIKDNCDLLYNTIRGEAMMKYERIDKDFGLDEEEIDEMHFKGCSLESDIEYILNSSVYEDIKEFITANLEKINRICTDVDLNVYTLLETGELYINNQKQNISSLVDIVYLDKLDILGITNDNRVIKIIGTEGINIITNNDIAYKKIIVSSGEIVCLTEDGYLVFQVYNPGMYDSRNLINIEDIKIENDEYYLLKDGEWFKL